MSKQNYINTIEALFPIDSQWYNTSEVGKRLLLEAIQETDWRNLPEEVLRLWAIKCQWEDNRQTRASIGRY